MEGRTIISWTPENWLTVLLMVWLGSIIVAFVARLIYTARGGDAA